MGVPEGSDLFFGFIGVACALVFASKKEYIRFGGCLWNGKVRSRNRLYGSVET